jgi:hypothetical protein
MDSVNIIAPLEILSVVTSRIHIDVSAFRMVKSTSVGNNVEDFLRIVLQNRPPGIATQVADV